MCFGGSKSPPPPPPPPAPVPQPAPVRNDEEVRRQTDEQLDLLRRRQGRAATNLTGGLGDVGSSTVAAGSSNNSSAASTRFGL
jgi:hypothetical protein